LYLDQNETWPHLVQEKLNERRPNSQVWVGNIGKSARKTPDHVLQLKYLLPQYPRLDAVILLLGASDLFLTLRWGDGENNPYYSTGIGTRQAALKRAFDVVVEQDPFAPYYEQTAMWRIINRIRQAQTQVATLDETEVEDEAGRVYIERRQKRQESQILDELPDLSVGLAEYARNVNNIINVAQAHGVRVILMTQPTLWRPDLSQQEEALLWLGQGPGRKYFYSPAALEKAITLYNQQLLDICQQRQVECIDLAPAIPKTGAMYYDDAHFTEAGAREVADFVADYLTSHPPFSTQ
jgi:lysophospholipase L1-like esterase